MSARKPLERAAELLVPGRGRALPAPRADTGIPMSEQDMSQHSVSKGSFSQVAQDPFLAGKTVAGPMATNLQAQQPSQALVPEAQPVGIEGRRRAEIPPSVAAPVALPQASGRLGVGAYPQTTSHSGVRAYRQIQASPPQALWSDPALTPSAAPSPPALQAGRQGFLGAPQTGTHRATVQRVQNPYLLAGNLGTTAQLGGSPGTMTRMAGSGIGRVGPKVAAPTGHSAGQRVQAPKRTGTQPGGLSGATQFGTSGPGARFGPARAKAGSVAPSTEGRQKVRREPPVDVYDIGEEIVIECELPGVTEENLVLTGHGRGISIQGVSESELEESGLVQQERGVVEYVREIPTNMEILADEATATFENGILEVRVPKKEPSAGIQEIDIE